MSLISQTTAYTTPGTYTYVIPQGVSALEFYLWGAGGANGSSGETLSRQTGTRRVGSVQTGTQVVGTVVVQAGIAAGQEIVSSSRKLVVPAGVTAVTVTAIGGGGGGGGSDGGDKNHNIYGLGGGAGQLASTTVSVVPGQVITAAVGRGGKAGSTASTGGAGKPTTVAINGSTVVTAAGGGGGSGRAVKAPSPGQNTAVGAGSGGAGSDKGYKDTGSPGSSGTVLIEWSAVPEVVEAISAPVYTPTYEPVFTSYLGGAGGIGGAGGYANRKVRVSPGDVIVVSVGSAGIRYAGGTGLTTPSNFSGGSAGSGDTQGGGGGAATVVTVNGQVVAVAAGGGGGGSGGPLGTIGRPGTGGGIIGGTGGNTVGGNSSSGTASGGGGGGGYFGGEAGFSGEGAGGGQGGISYGTIIRAGTTIPGGTSVAEYPASRPGYPETNGAAVLTFTKSFNINVKQTNNWKSVDRAWVKVNGVWKELLNGWTKVSGTWAPLITARSIEGAEDLSASTVVYTLTPDVSVIDEGETVTFTLGGTGLTNGTVVHYTATGIDASALSAGALSGNFIVGTTDTITFTPKLNRTTYGSRTIKVFLDNRAVSASCVVNNISLNPVYSIFGNTGSINEGGSVTFTMNTAGAVIGEAVGWSISGISAADLSSGAMTGQFIVGSVESASFTLADDLTTEGTESIIISLDGKGASASCAIADTSKTPVPFTGSLTISGDGTWTVPDYVTSATFTICGGGGGGGGSDQGGDDDNLWGVGGEAADLVTKTISVTAGQTYSYSMGAGGNGADTWKKHYPSGGTGGTSTIIRGFDTIVTASGGVGGISRSGKSFSPGKGSSNGGAGGGNGSTTGYGSDGSAGQSGFGIITWSGIAPG